MLQIHDSKKITGLVVVLIALIVLMLIAVAAIAFLGVGEGLFEQVAAMMTGTGVAHQAGQSVIDRAQAQNNSPTVSKTIASPPPPGVDKAATLG